jgi:hypothetical protein
LLDVKLQVAERIALQCGLRDLREIQSEVFDRFAHGNAVSILAGQKFRVELSHQRAAADERRAEAHTFLFGEADDFDSERKLAIAQRLEQRDSEHYTDNPIIGPGVGHGIEVRTEE